MKIGIIFGGRSEEHPISVKSAQQVAENIDTAKYEPFYIGITQDGAWKLCDGPATEWENGACRPVMLSPDRTTPGLLVLDDGKYETISLDVLFPVLHGKQGEDGAIQGLLELSGLPYVGCDIQSSVLCMDKSLAYIVAASAGIATPKFWTFTASQLIDPDQFDQLFSKLGKIEGAAIQLRGTLFEYLAADIARRTIAPSVTMNRIFKV